MNSRNARVGAQEILQIRVRQEEFGGPVRVRGYFVVLKIKNQTVGVDGEIIV